MKKILTVGFLTLLFSLPSFAQNRSVYTLLTEYDCKPAPQSKDGHYVGRCPGVGGYKLEFAEDDLRQNVWAISPAGKTFDLNLWGLRPGFSAVGGKVEWRVKGKAPVGIILRYIVDDPDSEEPTDTISYLMVGKVTKKEVCITDFVDPSKSQNATARRLADSAGSRPCKQPE